MRYLARLKGSGTAEVAAFGVADAEHALGKELLRAWPTASLDIREIHRKEAAPRIVESFVLVYTIGLEAEVEGEDEKSARSAAFSAARRALEGTRFARVAWDQKVVLGLLPATPPAPSTSPVVPRSEPG